MNTEVKKLEKSMVEIKAVFDTEEWAAAQEKALNKLAGSVKLDGFRKGHAPKNLIKAKIGAKALREQAVEEILSENYAKIFVDNNVTPVAQPTANVVKSTETELEVTFTCPVKPEFELGEYKGLEVKKTQVRVTKKDVEERLNDYQKQFAELVVKEEGTVEEGDTAVIDYEGFKDGVAFEGGKASDYPLTIGSGAFIPGFEDQLIGANIDEEKEINVTFPEEYQAKELAGKAAVFKCTVHSIKAKELPELDDEFVSDVSEKSETVDAYKAEVKAKIKERKENEGKQKREDQSVEQAVANAEMDIPEAMISFQSRQMVDDFARRIMQQGMTMEQYFQFTGLSEEKMMEEFKPEAEKRIRTRLTLEAIVAAENIEVSEERLDEELQKMADSYKMEVDKLKEYMGENEKKQMKEDIAIQEAVTLIANAAVEG